MKSATPTSVSIRIPCRARKSQTVSLAAVMVMASALATSAASLTLEGQSKNAAGWTPVHLTGWEERDEVPCRVLITGGPVEEQTVSIHFPQLAHDRPGFEDLGGFEPSPNAVITSAPVLSTTVDGQRTCTFTVKVTDSHPAFVEFKARLAVGSYKNPGSSLMLRGEPSSMGNLQIFKPAARRAPVLRLRIVRSETLPDDAMVLEFDTEANRRYEVEYSKDFKNWTKCRPLVVGTGAAAQWTDGSLPTKSNKPTGAGGRGYYRVMVLPDDC